MKNVLDRAAWASVGYNLLKEKFTESQGTDISFQQLIGQVTKNFTTAYFECKKGFFAKTKICIEMYSKFKS